MQTNTKSTLLCYNRGCGLRFDPDNNKSDSCCYHPGEPFFHDAYKGWTCCNKKFTDFTEFLNTKGCALSRHSNVKPPEPIKPAKQDIPDAGVIEVKPIVKSKLQRPPIDTPLTILIAKLTSSFQQQLKTVVPISSPVPNGDLSEIPVGSLCQNSGCNCAYEAPDSNSSTCLYHPGKPIFHEGMKYWSCCKKFTSDFNAFINQQGCTSGQHDWIVKKDNSENVNCRWDYHQTATQVVITIYAKSYCPKETEIKLNPIRLLVKVVFPQESNAVFNMDHELNGIVNVEESQVKMFSTKIEIKLIKAEPGSWVYVFSLKPKKADKKPQPKPVDVEKIQTRVKSVDLSDL